MTNTVDLISVKERRVAFTSKRKNGEKLCRFFNLVIFQSYTRMCMLNVFIQRLPKHVIKPRTKNRRRQAEGHPS